jgi:glycosyltransferase involved in cell wall biosynthesis
MTVLSLCIPYWNNAGMLYAQESEWSALPQAVKDRLEIVICDDASDVAITRRDVGIKSRTFRIQPPHVMWSQCCATNIAANYATGPWLLLTDIDHIVPAETFYYLLNVIDRGILDGDVAYRFARKDVDGSDRKQHPNSWIMHASVFHASGGHDERLRGLYNQDGTFIERVKRVAEIRDLSCHIIRVGRETIADASTPEQYRDKQERMSMALEVNKRKHYWRRQMGDVYWQNNMLSAAHVEIK